jgi:hypothetical protein
MPDQRGAQTVETGQYVYAVLPVSGVPGAPLTGIDDAAVEFVELGELAAAVTPLDLGRRLGRRKDLLAHSGVLEGLAARTPVVPVQFGSVLAGTDSVVSDLLEPGRQHFLEVLGTLAGRAQFNLRATYDRDQVLAEIVSADPVVADLRRRTRDLPPGTLHPDLVALGEAVARAWEAKRAEESGSLLSHVLPLVEAFSERNVAGDHVFDVALLVEDTRRDELEATLEDLAEAVHERMGLRLVGPLPAYDFVGEAAWV